MDKLRLTLSILALLLIGFLGGFLTSRTMVKSEVKKVVRTRPGQGFEERLMHDLKLKPAQEAIIRPIMVDFSKELHENYKTSNENKRQIVDELKSSIEPHLDQDQMEDFENFFKRMKKKRHYDKSKLKKKQKRSPKLEKANE